MSYYRIEANNVEGLAARLVQLVKLEVAEGRLEGQGAKGNRLTCELADGSKVTIRLGDKELDESVRDGIEIEGRSIRLCRFCNEPAARVYSDGVPVCDSTLCRNKYLEA